MTLKKYARLVLVSIFPLLLAGYLAAVFIWPFERHAAIACQPSLFHGQENCRDVGEREFWEATGSGKHIWFRIHYSQSNKSDHDHKSVKATAKTIYKAEIIGAQPFVGYGPDVKSFMGALAGRNAVMNLGRLESELSDISDQAVILSCNDLWVNGDRSEFESQCFGRGWGGFVTYRLTGSEQAQIEDILTKVDKLTEVRESNYKLYQALMYPILLYVFFVVSFMIWLLNWAVRFVKKG